MQNLDIVYETSSIANCPWCYLPCIYEAPNVYRCAGRVPGYHLLDATDSLHLPRDSVGHRSPAGLPGDAAVSASTEDMAWFWSRRRDKFTIDSCYQGLLYGGGTSL